MIFLFTHFLFITMLFSMPQQTPPVESVSFISGTRGYSENIRVTPDSIFVEKNGFRGNTAYQEEIKPEDWQLILSSLQGVELSEIHTLPAPSMNRASDGAMFSRLSITSNKQTYSSQEFDNHHPPKPLQPLMKAIDSLVMKE